MRNGLIVMTACPPTIGHQYLIDFAEKYLATYGVGTLTVLVCSRDSEPLDGHMRAAALAAHYADHERVRIMHRHENDPQNPEDHPNFYAYWADVLQRMTGVRAGDIVFASDMYGVDLARALECEFVPCDIYREIHVVSATAVRSDLIRNFRHILPEFQAHLRRTITVFGAESTGKTTLAKGMAAALDSQFLPEWARQYLMAIGYETTPARMEAIIRGQFAVQDIARRDHGKPFIIQDTDLLCTIGYFRIMNIPMQEFIMPLFWKTRSDLYIVTNSKIPFTADPIRYGGDHRESSDEFWIELLKEHNCRYVVVEATAQDQQLEIALEAARDLIEDQPVARYVRKTYPESAV